MDIENVPEMGRVIDHIYFRYNKGLGSNVLVEGPSGSGKSYVCERGCELFNIKLNGEESKLDTKHILDSPLKIIGFVKDSPQGSQGNVEEIGSLYNSRRSMVSENVDINRILDTIRKRKLILFSNCPSVKTADKAFVRHAHIIIQILGIIKGKKICIFKAFKCQYNSSMDKIYRHSFKDKRGHDIGMFYAKLPSKYIIDMYEKSKDVFLEDLYEKIKMRTLEKEAKENSAIKKKIKLHINGGLTDKEKKVFDMKYLDQMSQAKISRILGVSENDISLTVRRIRDKINISEETKKP